MNHSNLIFPTVVIGALVLLFMPRLFPEPEPVVIDEVKEVFVYCFEHHKQEQIWHIKGRAYFVKESPRGYPEIVGLYGRFHKEGF